MSNIAAVILAAGFSRRLGRPKQTVVIDGETLLARAVHVATASGFSPVIVILNTEFNGDTAAIRDCLTLANDEAAEGIASSIRLGTGAARMLQATGAVFLTCDQVALREEHLRALCAMPGEISGSGYAGKIGIPAYFPASVFEALLGLHGDVGARDLLQGTRLVMAEELALDIDSEADLALAQERLAGSNESSRT